MAKGDSVIDLEKALYVLQKKNSVTGEWETKNAHIYRGRTDALTVLQRVRSKEPEAEWRQILKQEAERYREGWKDCVEHVRITFGLEIALEEPLSASVVPGGGGVVGEPVSVNGVDVHRKE